ncbi:MAG: FtsQ-type POTRA domain-containing protein [Pseudomonadota bacterium]
MAVIEYDPLKINIKTNEVENNQIQSVPINTQLNNIRTNEYQKKSYKNYVKYASIFLLAVGLCGLGYFFYRSELVAWFQIRDIQIHGQLTRAPMKEIEGLVTSNTQNQTLWSINHEQFEKDLSSLPWVKSVETELRWPRRLNIAISEHQPAALWRHDHFIDTAGFPWPLPNNNSIDSLPKLWSAPDQVERVVIMFKQMEELLRAPNLKLTYLRLTDYHSWELGVADAANEFQVLIDDEDTLDKVRRFLDLYPALTNLGGAADRFDLRYPRGISVQWDETIPQKDK